MYKNIPNIKLLSIILKMTFICWLTKSMTRVFAARVGEKPERNYFVIQSEKVDSPLYNQKSFFFTIKILSLNI